VEQVRFNAAYDLLCRQLDELTKKKQVNDCLTIILVLTNYVLEGHQTTDVLTARRILVGKPSAIPAPNQKQLWENERQAQEFPGIVLEAL
jgi:hypothetical protein